MKQPGRQVETSPVETVFALQKISSHRLRLSTAAERAGKLNRLKNWIKSNQDKIRKALYEDLGKPAMEADFNETYVVLSEIKYACKRLPKWMKPKPVKAHLPLLGAKSQVYYEPKGCALIISPWNYPFCLTILPLVSAIAAGCTAIIKPSELAPNTARLISEMIGEIFRENEIAVFEGGLTIAQTLVSIPFDHIFFSGSPKTGQSIMKSAADHLTSVTLELGGKSPVIIDKGCKLKEVAARVVWGKYINCGQTCVAPDYLLVHESELDLFLQELKIQVVKMYDPKGRGIEKSPDYGRIINKNHLRRLESLISDALSKGAKVEFGGNIREEIIFMAPTIVTQVGPNMTLMKEEIFGPILPILSYSDINQAVNFLNSKPKPLAFYIFSEETYFINFFISRTSSGTVGVNDCTLQFGHPGLPFGGVNQSGIGKAHGHYGFLAFSNEKAVLRQKTGITSLRLLYPPYGFNKNRIARFLSKWI
ncbi:MAG: aldehyde dehydrogenase family protein [Cyclobacteriaceae bacterium]